MRLLLSFGEKVENVIVGKVIEVACHPEDDNLRVVKIDINNEKKLVAVAKIPDILVGDLIPVALVGSNIPGKGVITKNIIKGVESECMVCHISDFGLSIKDLPFTKPSGLISFPKDVEVGMQVNDVLGLGDDIIEFEITPNRPDCLSVTGIARELAASLNKEFKDITKNSYNSKISKDLDGITVNVETNNCTRYMLKKVSDVVIKDSPIWLQIYLVKCGIRPINNIVDITNYIMLELGQPLHAFDLEKIEGKSVTVRQAKNEEKILNLDGVQRTLKESNMCICDKTKPIAIAGVIGGELSGITNSTTNVLFEAATFVRGSIRKTSKEQQVRTEASGRYEKGLPEGLAEVAINRTCSLLKELCIGNVEESVIDIYPNKQKETKIKLDYKDINKILGTNLDSKEMIKILNMLGIETKNDIANIPYFREDVVILRDVAEEVARIYGYDKIESTKISGAQTSGIKTQKQILEDKVKNTMIASGYNEIYTYTFFNKESLDKLNIPEEDEIRKSVIKVINPLSSDFTYIRTSTLPLMLDALDRNYNKKNLDVKLFELGKVFIDNGNIEKGELPCEKQVLTIGMYGNHDFYELKGDIRNLLQALKIQNCDVERYTNSSVYHPGQSAKLVIDGNTIGVFGKISPKVAKNFNIPECTFLAEIYFDNLKDYINNNIKFVELPKYPAVERDLAFTVKDEILAGNIIKKIKEVSENVESVVLFDVYKGLQITSGYKSMAYSIFLRDRQKTLNEQEINEIMSAIVLKLESSFDAKIRK